MYVCGRMRVCVFVCVYVRMRSCACASVGWWDGGVGWVGVVPHMPPVVFITAGKSGTAECVLPPVPRFDLCVCEFGCEFVCVCARA